MSQNLKTEVIPAIIPETFEQLKEEMEMVKGIVPLVQVDIMDGVYVPVRTWPYGEDRNSFEEIISEEKGFPFWEDLDFEADLMVKNPENIFFDWISAGAKRLIFHFESTESFGDLLAKVKKGGIEKESPIYVEIGIALKPSTSNEEIYPFLDEVDFIQFMGNDKIGFHGIELDERVLEKSKDVRQRKPNLPIAVDIGVNLETAPLLLEFGVNKLVSGSAILSSSNPEKVVSQFLSLG